MRLKTFIPVGSSVQFFDLFSYSSNGLPGLELVGLGPKAKTIKEKVLYLTKGLKVKIPLKRFVICLDGSMVKNSQEDYFELPILLLYWALAGALPVKSLRDCLCAGKISARGLVSLPPLRGQLLEDITLIGISQQQQGEDMRLIDVTELLPRFRYEVELNGEGLNHINIAR